MCSITSSRGIFPFINNGPECTFERTALGGKASLCHQRGGENEDNWCQDRESSFSFPVTVVNGATILERAPGVLNPVSTMCILPLSFHLHSSRFPSYQVLSLRHQLLSSPEATTHEALTMCQVSCHLLMCIMYFNPHKPTRQDLVSLSLFYRWQDSVGEPMQFACVIQQVTRKAEIQIHVCLTSKPTHSAVFLDITGNKSKRYS